MADVPLGLAAGAGNSAKQSGQPVSIGGGRHGAERSNCQVLVMGQAIADLLPRGRVGVDIVIVKIVGKLIDHAVAVTKLTEDLHLCGIGVSSGGVSRRARRDGR